MNFYDYKANGRAIVDEVILFSSVDDEALELTSSLLAYLDCVPSATSLELWTGLLKTGTQIPIQMDGAPSAGHVSIRDIRRGVLHAGTGVATTLYATYTGFGSPLRAREMQGLNKNYRSRYYLGMPSASEVIASFPIDYAGNVKDIRLYLQSAPISNATFTISDGVDTIDTITVTTGTFTGSWTGSAALVDGRTLIITATTPADCANINIEINQEY